MTLEELEAELVDAVNELAQWLKSSGISPAGAVLGADHQLDGAERAACKFGLALG